MMNTKEFADAVGRNSIADAVGVGLTAVSNAVVRGEFPASWFKSCLAIAKAAQIDCPLEMFAFKGNPQNVYDPAACQGAAE